MLLVWLYTHIWSVLIDKPLKTMINKLFTRRVLADFSCFIIFHYFLINASRFDSRSGPTYCQTRSGPKPFVRIVIN